MDYHKVTPEVCRFLGIVISVYFSPERHALLKANGSEVNVSVK